jgi:membrane protein YqaA with SNARE-associated domain
MDDAPTAPTDPARLDARRLILQTASVLVALGAAAAAAGRWLREPLLASGEAFVQRFGGPGVAMSWYLPDALPLPVVPDVFNAIALAGGLSFGSVVLWATVGSLAGDTTGWLLGKLLKRTPWLDRILRGRQEQARQLLDHYGMWALLVAAVTPLPYSVAAWGCGALDMPLGRFWLVSLARVVRVSSHLWLIQKGLMPILQ